MVPVEIIMESSKDLINWTRAEPGTYGADTPKRFFRVRAVVKPKEELINLYKKTRLEITPIKTLTGI